MSYLAKSILASLLVLMALPSLAEPSYYTWVDANGIVHNTLVTTEDEPANKSKVESDSQNSNTSGSPNTPEEYKDFKTEEELQQQIKSSTDKPFYTWRDADGTLRNSPKPDVVVEFSATEIVYDAVFAPPFRLPKKISEGVCCSDYKKAFKQVLNPDGSITQKINSDSVLYKTQRGLVPAGYFITEGIKSSIVFIKGFKLTQDTTFEVVALNSLFQPIHLASELSGIFVEQTWKDLAYNKVMIELSDPEIEYLIIFANQQSMGATRSYSLSLSLGQAND